MSLTSTRLIRNWSSLAFFASLIWLYIFCVNFWISDDAYITLRTIDNFFRGYGLRYNIEERVQAYTHPLWFLILLPFYGVSFSPLFTIFVPSLIATALALYLLYRKTADQKVALLLLLIAASSQAFVHYTSSGLENCIGFLICGLVFAACCFKQPYSPLQLQYYLCLAGFACLIRSDYLLLVAGPGLIFVIELWRKTTPLRWYMSLIIAALPLVAWHFFSLIYYGFFLPNTYYAKLATAVPLAERLHQGMLYHYVSMVLDPLTVLVIFLAILISLLRRNIPSRMCGASILLYMLYITGIGGDFMLGRFYAVPFYLSLLIISEAAVGFVSDWRHLNALMFIVGVSLLFHPFHILTTGVLVQPRQLFYSSAVIANEQAFYWNISNPFFGNPEKLPFDPLVANTDSKCIIEKNIGYIGYRLGPEHTVVDVLGLSSALLARVPANQFYGFRAGHLRRRLPDGYLELCEGEIAHLPDRKLDSYYQGLRTTVSGDYFSKERWSLMYDYNFGDRRRYSDHYSGESSFEKKLIDSELLPKKEGTARP